MSKISLEIFTIDAFTKSPFSGNPAAVCILDKPEVLELIHQRFPSEEEKEKFYKLIARELNLSETCFLWKIDQSSSSGGSGSGSGSGSTAVVDHRYKLRWFTPTVEVNLCGHATLASSELLFNKLQSVDKLFFETRSGELTVVKDEDGILKMNFPIGDPQVIHQSGSNSLFEQSVLIDLLQNINLVTNDLLSSNNSGAIIDEIVSEIVLCRKTKKLLIVVKNFDHVLGAEPNEQSLLNMDFKNEDLNTNIRGISVSMPVNEMTEENKKTLSNLSTDQTNQIDYVTRYFSPWNGLKEDPVNGSSQVSAAPYYSSKLNKKKLVCFQASKRTGILFVEPIITEGRVSIGGFATTVMHATMYV